MDGDGEDRPIEIKSLDVKYTRNNTEKTVIIPLTKMPTRLAKFGS